MSSSAGRTCSTSPLVVGVRRADQRLPEPRQHEDRPARARRGRSRPRVIGSFVRVDDDVRAAAGPDDRHLGLVVQLGRAQPVGPHAGGVDDVRRADLELVPALRVAHARTDGAPAVLASARPPRAGSRPRRRSAPPRRARSARAASRRSGSRRTGSRRSARGRRAPAAARAPRSPEIDPVARRAPVGLVATPRAGGGGSGRPTSRRRRSGRARRPGPAAGRRTPGTTAAAAAQVWREVDVDLALQQRLADEPEVEVLQVAQAAVDELGRARAVPRRSRRARPARPSTRAWRRRARRPRR